MTYAKGLDLSRYNGRGDWQAVRAAGISFVIIKAGGVYSATGVCYTDSLLAEHVAGARSVGIPFGLYWYFLPFTPVINQSHYFQALIDQYKPDLPHAIDIESNNGQSTSVVTSTLKDMVQLTDAIIHRPILYTRASWFNINVLPDPLWGQCDLWASRWKSSLISPWSDGYYKFRDWNTWRFWQYSGDNNAQAVNYGFYYGDPDIDLNWFNGTEADFRQWAGLPHIPTLQEQIDDLRLRVERLESKA